MKRLLAMLTASLMTLVVPAAAQQTLDEIKKQLSSQKSELDEVDALLAQEDKNLRIAAMELLLKSGNPSFVQRAKETGLFSSDPELQRAAVAAIFEAGGPFRLVADLTTAPEEKTKAKAWLSYVRGALTVDEKVGTYVFQTGPYDKSKQCWPFKEGRNCAFTLAGAAISLAEWRGVTGELTLSSDGVLAGALRSTDFSNTIPFPVSVSLID
ncbi:hypothetical protein [Methylobrevis albus]|uniref:HEAT repeat domain-containing protein n=1 Tax=Methylobrevis albus TaxID=2793297 RepID=A0A931I4R6_9HYPH|nr:hypothetical protein [Methylobrevis albus]MBH0239519.1 hypothetical protein [Methylobrevis albus]